MSVFNLPAELTCQNVLLSRRALLLTKRVCVLVCVSHTWVVWEGIDILSYVHLHAPLSVEDEKRML